MSGVRILFFLIGSLVSGSLQAQQWAFELWHTGKVILDTGDTLRGLIKYDLDKDIIQLQANNKLESYTSRKVLLFEIFDETVKRYRNFYSLPYALAGQYKAPVFFELLQEGKLTVLCREALEYRTTSSPYYFYGSYSRLVLVYKYYIMKENGEIEEFRGKKNDWLEFMRGKTDEVENFTKQNRLNFDDKYELSRIIEHYNSLFGK
ncbi:MAG TPA: hypothetical protein PLM56_04705 [Cyclobacteriaceae bacterium]|nr:hypothetical protein [Cyclobacteriaceae bacterium]HRF32773.1 hypothetical protein [Cyclobacteriaceae bacterium]